MSLPSFQEKASRLNFCIVRWLLAFVYGIIIFLVMWLFGILIGITFFINCLTVLIMGKRFKLHYNFVLRVAKWLGHVYMYFLAATDDVPPLFPPG
jgi:hypothetical protein